MSDFKKIRSDSKDLRAILLTFACLLGCFAAWSLSADLLRPVGIEFPADQQLAVSIFSQRDAAVKAAEIGLVRGDLWADAAFAYGSLLWIKDQRASDADVVPLSRTRSLTERAIAWAPHDARLWLLLAATYSLNDPPSKIGSAPLNNERLSAALRMCYYTGANTVALIRERLFLALQSQLLQDAEFQEFVRHDIKIAIIRNAEFAPVIAEAYRNAPAPGRQFIEKVLGELDPEMLASLQASGKSN